MAAPMPLEAPVTIATLSASFFEFVFISRSSGEFFVYSLGRVFNYLCNRVWLRHIDRMAAGHLVHSRTRALGHEPLCWRRNHFILRGDQIPTRLGLPCRLADCATKCSDAPWDLRVSHERGFFSVHVGSECG